MSEPTHPESIQAGSRCALLRESKHLPVLIMLDSIPVACVASASVLTRALEASMTEFAWLCQQHSGLSDLREGEVLVDVDILTSTGCVPAHRVILAAHSRFFRARFSQEWRGQEARSAVDLQHLLHDVVLHIVRALYSGRMQLDDGNALDVLSTACELDIPCVVEAATAVRRASSERRCVCSGHMRGAPRITVCPF